MKELAKRLDKMLGIACAAEYRRDDLGDELVEKLMRAKARMELASLGYMVAFPGHPDGGILRLERRKGF